MHSTFQQLEVELTASLADLTAAQTQATPLVAPEKWSIQQIVEHLLLTYGSTKIAFAKRLERGSPTQARPTLSQRFGQFYIVTLGRFPAGRTAPAAVSPSHPSSLQNAGQLTGRMHADLYELDRVAEQAQLAFGSCDAVSHMVLGPMPVQSWRRFHLVHGRVHIRQILSIRAAHHL